MTKKETIIVLFSITLCWSSSYIFIKDLSSAFSAYAYLTLTSGFAGIGLALAFRHLIKKLDKKTILYGSVLALLKDHPLRIGPRTAHCGQYYL